MAIPQFKLPTTTMTVVVWYRDGKKNETLIPTPRNTEQLATVMLSHRVGASEIRAVKPVNPNDLQKQLVGNFGRR